MGKPQSWVQENLFIDGALPPYVPPLHCIFILWQRNIFPVSQSFMDTTKVDLVQETLGTSEEQLLLIIQAYEDESMG